MPKRTASPTAECVGRAFAPPRRRRALLLPPNLIRLGLIPLGLMLLMSAAPATAEPQSDQAAMPLRLCADPTNPPFSSSGLAEPGMYLELGAAIGQALNRPVVPVWQLTYFGKHATRDTLLAGKCDMSVGLPADHDFMAPRLIFSHPFLRIGFAVVAPHGVATSLASMRGKRVAVQFGTPPQSVLAEHDDITSATFLDPESAMQALAEGRVDAAFVWGPSAGYLNHVKLHDRFAVTPVSGDGMQWNAAVGFASNQVALRDQVDRALATLGGTVAGLAAKYGFPAQPPLSLSWASDASHASSARFSRLVYDGAASRPHVTLVADDTGITDDQKDDADLVAPNPSDVDIKFHPATTPTAAADGRTTFNGTCNHCHGPDAETAVKKIDLRLLQHRYGSDMDEVFHYTVTHGRPSKGMPNWSGVFSENDFANILAFLQTIQTK